MPCFFPLQATFSIRDDGKKDIRFSRSNSEAFQADRQLIGDSNISLPCGRCMGCRLEKSRQWAMRCVHESKMYDDNCFVTLTFSPEHLPADGSLRRKHVQDFMKRLRAGFVPPVPDGFDKQAWLNEFGVRVFYCGEYGSDLGRPHYHLCLFNLDFSDKERFKKIGDYWHYTSAILSELWPFGHSTVGDFCFDTAAYVARYCTKKINGNDADAHYTKVNPFTGETVRVVSEFCGMSLKPGIGKSWLDKFGKTDVFPHDDCIVNGVKCKPPRYYDILRDRVDPDGFALAKESRRLKGEDNADDNTFSRLATKMKCQEARFKLLIRKMEL